jgi:hypothetical protein
MAVAKNLNLGFHAEQPILRRWEQALAGQIVARNGLHVTAGQEAPWPEGLAEF